DARGDGAGKPLARFAGQEKRRAHAVVAAVASTHIEQRSVRARYVAQHIPPLIANAHDVAGTQQLHARTMCTHRSRRICARNARPRSKSPKNLRRLEMTCDEEFAYLSARWRALGPAS